MKNYLALVLGVIIMASPAFASRARLEALGEGKNGSYYIQDSRNMFLNPATIVKNKKKLMLELGGDPVNATTSDGTAVAASANTREANSSRAQGGFTNTFGDFTYGLYLNNTSDRAISTIASANAIAGALGSTAAWIAPTNAWEFFFAGEGAVNWGISVFHAGNENKAAGGVDKTAYYWGTRLGVDMNNWSLFSTIGIASSSKMNNATATTLKRSKRQSIC